MSEPIHMSEVVRPPSAYKPQTPEGVALELMERIFLNELAKPTREEILSTYSECLRTVRGLHEASSHTPR